MVNSNGKSFAITYHFNWRNCLGRKFWESGEHARWTSRRDLVL